MAKTIVKLSTEKTTSQVIGDTIQALAQGITGLAAAEKREIILSIGRVFQSIRGGHLLGQLQQEWDDCKEKGRIKDEYEFSEQHLNCLHELLDFLDKDIPDEARFNAMKKILLVAATEEVESRESVLPHQYIKICRKLSSGAILVLIANYHRLMAMSNRPEPRTKVVTEWLEDIADRSGLKYTELIVLVENELIDNNLITSRYNISKAAFTDIDRLTVLGYDLCAFIKHYDASE